MSEEIVLLLREIRDIMKSIGLHREATHIASVIKAEERFDVNDIEPKVVSLGLANDTGTKSIDMGKTYSYMSKKGIPYVCNKCSGFISWELRPERSYPLHVNQEGKIVNDGNCPEFQP